MATSEDIAFWKGTTWIVTAYLVALAVGVLTGELVGTSDALQVALIANIAATTSIFVFSFAFQNTSFYDAYWSVAPIAIIVYWVAVAGETGDAVRQGLVLICISVWGIRLTANWLTGWTGLHHEDWRYRQLQQQTGRLYWLVSFAGLHMFPTLIVFLCLWSGYVATSSDTPLQTLDIIAACTMLLGVFFEALADHQLRTWRARNEDPAAYIDEGLWHYSRHPNYLGELMVWIGLWLFAMAARPGLDATVLGPVAMASMFRFVSIPMMEERMLRKRPTYQAQIDTTSMLFLWPPRSKPVTND
jgi:steroid 5-alpha reductase family enzyme